MKRIVLYTTRVLLVVLYIYLGEMFKYWHDNETIKMPRWEAPITMQWFVYLFVFYVRPLLFSLIIFISRKDVSFLKWCLVIIATYSALDLVWWLINFESKGPYWMIFWTIALVDTIFFRKYWQSVFKPS